jgi:hypothetical protein
VSIGHVDRMGDHQKLGAIVWLKGENILKHIPEYHIRAATNNPV